MTRGGAEAGRPVPAKPGVAVFRVQLLPGSETFIRDQADALSGWRPVTVGALRVDSPLARADDLVLYDVPAGCRRGLRDRAALLFAEWTGIAPRLTRTLRALRDEGEVRVVHAHFAKDAWLVARAARRAGLPLVVTCHGYDVTSLAARRGIAGAAYRWRARRVLSGADAVVAVSGFIAERARELGASAPRVAYTGVRLAGRRSPEDIGEPGPGSSDIVFVGRLVPKKGVDDLLRAIPRVSRNLAREVRVLVVGDGPLLPELRELTVRLGIGDSVVFAGALPPAAVDAAMASSRVFCGPSRTAPDGDSEGFGQVFLEAARSGLPVVSRRHGGVPEAVAHGTTGLLSAPGDDAALAGDLTALLGDDLLRERMGAAGRRRATVEFDMGRCVRALEDVYLSVTR